MPPPANPERDKAGFPRGGKHCHKLAAMAVNVFQIVRTRELTVRDIQKVRSTDELPQDVPSLAVRLIIDGVSAMRRKVNRHAAVFRDRQGVEQLFEVGPVILTMSIGDRDCLLALLNAFFLGIGIGPEHGHGRGVVVQFVQREAKFLNDPTHKFHHELGLATFKQPV